MNRTTTMLYFRNGDIFDVDVEALVNPVNCVGVIGRGLALAFKRAFPSNFDSYRAACDRGEVRPGRMFVFETGSPANPRFIVNFPTKRHWREKAAWTTSNPAFARSPARSRDGASIAIPALSAGLGSLAWTDVHPRIEAALRGASDLHAIVFAPHGAPVKRIGQSIPRADAPSWRAAPQVNGWRRSPRPPADAAVTCGIPTRRRLRRRARTRRSFQESIMCKVLNKRRNGMRQGAVYIGRGSRWGNPFRIGPDGDRTTVIAKHESWLRQQDELLDALDELRGRDLVCFCAPAPCHGDLLLRLANGSREAMLAWRRS